MGAEIISGDSIQVYKGLDIGSGKIKEEEKEGIKHYLLDILSPKENYNVKMFQEMAREIINHSTKPIIICGGTGLYLKACLYDYSFVEEEEEIDEELEELSNEELYALLLESDPKQAQKIHLHNRRRLLRSLRIQKRSGLAMSEHIAAQSHEPIYDCFIAGCTMEREELYQRINQRVEKMIEEGLEEEIKSLLESGVSFEDQSMQGIGYKEWKEYIEGKASKQEVIEEIQKHSRQFAKRQYTWFKHQMSVHWFNVDESEEMMDEIVAWYERN